MNSFVSMNIEEKSFFRFLNEDSSLCTIVCERRVFTPKNIDAAITEYDGISNQLILSFIEIESLKREFIKNTENINILIITNIPLIWPPLKAAKNLKNITPNAKEIKIMIIEKTSETFIKLIFDKKNIINKPKLMTTKLARKKLMHYKKKGNSLLLSSFQLNDPTLKLI